MSNFKKIAIEAVKALDLDTDQHESLVQRFYDAMVKETKEHLKDCMQNAWESEHWVLPATHVEATLYDKHGFIIYDTDMPTV